MAIVSSSGGALVVGGVGVLFAEEFSNEIVIRPLFPVPGPTVRSAADLSTEIELPAGAFIERASVVVTAAAPGTTPIGDVAEVRDGGSGTFVLDFHGLRTVGGVMVAKGVASVKPWEGSRFGDALLGDALTYLKFSEILTERLQVATTKPAGVDDLRTGTVDLYTPPADLDLTVAGTRVFFHAGPAPAPFEETVDLRAAIQAAIDAGTPGTPVTVPIRLTSSVPGALRLAPTISFLKTHEARFASGPARAVDVADEGEITVAIPLPGTSVTDGWKVGQVEVLVKGTPGPTRVLPPTGPPTYPDLQLTLTVGRAFLVELPRAHVDRLATLTAVRLLVLPEAAGIELAAVLRGEEGGQPGALFDDVAIGPVVVPGPAAGTGATWITLPFAGPFDLERGRDLWLELQVARGRAGWPLADTAALAAALGRADGRWPLAETAAPDADDARARVLRRVPNGRLEAPSSPGGLSTDSAALRLVGTAPDNEPLPALAVRAGERQVSVTPTADGVLAVLVLADPLEPAEVGGEGRFDVRMVATAPGSYSVGPVTVAYRDAGSKERR